MYDDGFLEIILWEKYFVVKLSHIVKIKTDEH